MKKKRIYRVLSFFLLCSAVICMMSCSSYVEDTNTVSFNQPKSHRITAEQAMQNAINFVGQIQAPTRSNGIPLTVAEVKAIGINEGLTRSSNENFNMDSLFYIVNFANKQGFVIAASDDRETPIFAYIEEGSYEEDDTLNNGYQAFIDALIDEELSNQARQERIKNNPGDDSIDKRGIGCPNYRPNKFEVMFPLLKTKWGQRYYATYCPNQITGCVVTAVAQICSFLKMPNHVAWGYNGVGNQCYMDWDNILDECNRNNGNLSNAELRDQVANLMRFWGLAFDADYDDESTGVDSDDAMSKMRDFGYNVTGLTDYDAVNVINDLRQGNRIIYMRGDGRYYHVGLIFRKYVDGHGWVVDGYIDTIKNNKETLYLHCNWGWGGEHNGYFLADVFNTEEDPYYDDNANPITRRTNFQYNLETATICK
jgi:hypothetical protein